MQMQNPAATSHTGKSTAHQRPRFTDHPATPAFLGKGWTNQLGVTVSGADSEPQKILALTERERDVLQLIRDGHSNKEAALSLGIAPDTVKSHLKNIFKKLCVERRITAISRALSLGIITLS